MSSYHSLKTYEDAARRFLDDINGHPGLENQGKRETDAQFCFDSEVNITAYRIGEKGFVLAECRKWLSDPDFRNPTQFLYQVRCSKTSDRVVIMPIDLNDWSEIAANVKKITEVKINLSSANKEFIERIIKLLFAKVRDEISLRSKLRVVDVDEDSN